MAKHEYGEVDAMTSPPDGAAVQSATEIIRDLDEQARRPRLDARAMPASVYWSEAFHAAEIQKIFRAEWCCVGREQDLAGAGSYVTCEIAGEPVIVVRDEDKGIRALSNICRHRMARLLEGSGTVKRISCPYHAWAYDLSGALARAPLMPEDFRTDGIRLPEFAVDIWNGFVYVSLDRDAEPLTSRLTDLTGRLANFRIDEFVPLFRARETWNNNWKSLVENFTEPYHFAMVHTETVEPALPTRLTDHEQECGEAYNIFHQHRVPGSSFEYDGDVVYANDQLAEAEQLVQPIICIYPSHLIALSAERLFWLSLQPEGTDHVNIFWGVDVFPGTIPAGEEGEQRKQELRASFERINEEDRGVVEQIQRNVRSPFAEPGPIAPKERSLWEFQRYLARRLGAG